MKEIKQVLPFRPQWTFLRFLFPHDPAFAPFAFTLLHFLPSFLQTTSNFARNMHVAPDCAMAVTTFLAAWPSLGPLPSPCRQCRINSSKALLPNARHGSRISPGASALPAINREQKLKGQHRPSDLRWWLPGISTNDRRMRGTCTGRSERGSAWLCGVMLSCHQLRWQISPPPRCGSHRGPRRPFRLCRVRRGGGG
jgi:hypothetical protein